MIRLVIVTGLSGSGKTVALHTLEDGGYYCIDNLPLALVQAVTDHLVNHQTAHHENIALGIDARAAGHDLTVMPGVIAELRAHGVEVRTLFLEADNAVLLQRFSETRRRHPLAMGSRPLASAIETERELLSPFRQSADLVVDTSRRTLHELRELTRQQLRADIKGLSLCFQSFGFKHGIPMDGDLVFDARCLPNPYWKKELRPLTGKDPAVALFLQKDERVTKLFDEIARFVATWMPHFEQEGRSYLTVCIGCTGGQHRSVYMVEQLAGHFSSKGHQPLVVHREIQ